MQQSITLSDINPVMASHDAATQQFHYYLQLWHVYVSRGNNDNTFDQYSVTNTQILQCEGYHAD